MPTHLLKKLSVVVAGCLLAGVTFCVLFFFLFEPSREQFAQSQRLSSAIGHARSVTFVEFSRHRFDPESEKVILEEHVLQKINATPEQVARLGAATSSFVVWQTHYSIAGCFDPHHRVEIVRPDGTLLRFDICFHCRNFSFDAENDQPIPIRWLSPLREIFGGLGMLSRPEGDYYTGH